eukprot:sb/3468678/
MVKRRPLYTVVAKSFIVRYSTPFNSTSLNHMVIEAGGDVIEVSVVPCGLAGDVRGFSLTQIILVITFRRKCHLQNTTWKDTVNTVYILKMAFTPKRNHEYYLCQRKPSHIPGEATRHHTHLNITMSYFELIMEIKSFLVDIISFHEIAGNSRIVPILMTLIDRTGESCCSILQPVTKVRFKRLDLRFLEIKGRSVYLLKGDPEFPGILGQVQPVTKVRFKRLDLRFLEIKGRSVYLLKGDPEFPGILGQVV